MIETDSPQFRVDSKQSQLDTLLIALDVNGSLLRVISFSLGGNKLDMFSFAQNLILTNNYYYMSGSMRGFESRLQASL